MGWSSWDCLLAATILLGLGQPAYLAYLVWVMSTNFGLLRLYPLQSSQAWIGQTCCGLAFFIISPVCAAGVVELGLGRGRDRSSRRRGLGIGPVLDCASL